MSAFSYRLMSPFGVRDEKKITIFNKERFKLIEKNFVLKTKPVSETKFRSWVPILFL